MSFLFRVGLVLVCSLLVADATWWKNEIDEMMHSPGWAKSSLHYSELLLAQTLADKMDHVTRDELDDRVSYFSKSVVKRWGEECLLYRNVDKLIDVIQDLSTMEPLTPEID